MSIGFPQVKNSVFTCEDGVNLVSTIVNNEFKWIFRPNFGLVLIWILLLMTIQ
jgi:hypothetical protein